MCRPPRCHSVSIVVVLSTGSLQTTPDTCYGLAATSTLRASDFETLSSLSARTSTKTTWIAMTSTVEKGGGGTSEAPRQNEIRLPPLVAIMPKVGEGMDARTRCKLSLSALSRANSKTAEQQIRIDRSGDRFGRLTYLYPIKVKRHTHWMCVCDCGNDVLIGSSLTNRVRSCGCLRRDATVDRNRRGWKGFGDIHGAYISQIKHNAKVRGLEFDLTAEDLWNLFLLQERKCALTGMVLTFGTKRRGDQTASLDRIDSGSGYTIANVQWVHRTINLIRNCIGLPEFVALCTMVADYDRQKSK